MNTALLKTLMRFCTIAGVERIFVIVYSCMDLEIKPYGSGDKPMSGSSVGKS